VYVIGLGLSHALLRPSVRRMIAIEEELVAVGPPPRRRRAAAPGVELEERGGRVRIVATVLQVNLVVILMLMVWGPRF
jgi:hypothetical protein